jgi:hypothetical protein
MFNQKSSDKLSMLLSRPNRAIDELSQKRRFSIRVNKDIFKISDHFDSQMIGITVAAAVVFVIIVTVACFIFILRRRRRKAGELKIQFVLIER